MKKKRRIFILALLSLSVILIAAWILARQVYPTMYIAPAGNSLSVQVPSMENGEIREDTVTLVRGTAVKLRKRKTDTSMVEYEGKTLEVPSSSLSETYAGCVQVPSVFVRTRTELRKEKNGPLCQVAAEKGEELKVVSASVQDLDSETGMVNWYEVVRGDETYWIPGQYVEPDEESVHAWDEPNVAVSDYWNAAYGEGYSTDAFVAQEDWKPAQKVDFADNPRKDDVRGLHVTLEQLAANPDYYLSLKDRTDLNALVVELKNEGGLVEYESPAAAKWLDTGYQGLSLEQLRELVRQFQDAGYYMIGRISAFKDPVFATAYPEEAIQTTDGQLLEIAQSTWASPYSRKAWEYNADLCEEAAGLFNEVQLDYTRFPEGLATMQGEVELHNTYDESKASAIQHFTQYVRDRVHEHDAYLSVDVFAQVLTAMDDQDLGQYVPGLCIAADYVSPMPYPDHFVNGSLGVENPAMEQGEMLKRYSQIAQSVYADDDQYRPWLQGYSNTAQDVQDQIRAVEETGFKSWLIWCSNGDTEIVEPRVKGMKTVTGKQPEDITADKTE